MSKFLGLIEYSSFWAVDYRVDNMQVIVEKRTERATEVVVQYMKRCDIRHATYCIVDDTIQMFKFQPNGYGIGLHAIIVNKTVMKPDRIIFLKIIQNKGRKEPRAVIP